MSIGLLDRPAVTPTQVANKLVVLDVGHGNCAVLREADAIVVVDAGPGSHLLEYTRQQQIERLGLVLISHSDKDHIAGLIALLASDEVLVDEIRLNPDSDKKSQIWQDLIFTLEAEHNAKRLSVSLELKVGKVDAPGLSEAALEVMSPSIALAGFGAGACNDTTGSITANSMSAVVKVSYKQKAIALLTGDMDEVTLADIERRNVNLKAKFLVFPHHGGLPGKTDPTQFAERLLKHVEPAGVIFSIGREKHDNPHPTIVSSVMKFNPTGYVACTQLSRRCAKDSLSVAPTHLGTMFSAGTVKGRCCAGTVEIDLESATVVSPKQQSHRAFIQLHVPSPMCSAAK